MSVRHVLLDADGVLQDGSTALLDGLTRYLGNDAALAFLGDTFGDDPAVLRGEVELVELLHGVLPKDVDIDAFYAQAAFTITVLPHTHGLISQLRERGYGVHLGTNQDPGRGRYMGTELGYDDLFDVSCYSCDLGAAKPTVAFFEAAASRIGADAAEIVFVDDSEANVIGARDAGLQAIHWHHHAGLDDLASQLTAAGINIETLDSIM